MNGCKIVRQVRDEEYDMSLLLSCWSGGGSLSRDGGQKWEMLISFVGFGLDFTR